MYRKSHPLFMICHTPTHVGSGSDLGIVDLPIQRERHTKFPKFEGSSVKGAIREAFERRVSSQEFASADAPGTMIHRLFGYDEGSLTDSQKKGLKKHFKNKKGEEQTSFAGALGFSDARMLLFPVKSMKGVFAWITCFRALKQFEKDMQLSNKGFHFKGLNEDYLKEDRQQTYLFSPNSPLLVKDKVILEEFTFKVANELNGTVQVVEKEGESPVDFPHWLAQHLFDGDGSYWCDKLKTDIVVLPDDDFTDFVNQSTEVITRTKIDNNTGTVAKGALFTEEYLPSDSIMYTLVLTSDEFREEPKNDDSLNPIKQDKVYEFFNQNLPDVVQIGGNATLGKGIVRTKLLNL
ncbi:MAG: type III-B CRISPR module RAMP protein Cmr4 [bacterium]|nr:type III-B CRISPR module RAMP protein Cmr4 [bacterium]